MTIAISRVGLVVLLLSIPFYVSAQPDMMEMMEAPPASLEAFISEALSNNPSLRANALEQEAREQRVRQVTAWPDPTATVHMFPSPIMTARGPFRFQIDLAQRIPYPPSRRIQGEMAQLHSEHGEHERAVYSLDLQLKIKSAYVALVGLQDQAALLDSFETRLKLFEDAAAVRYEVGSGSQQSLLKAQLEKQSLALRRERLWENRHAKMRELAYLMNRTNTTGLDSLPRWTPEFEWRDLTEWETEAIRTRPELTFIRHADLIAEQNESLARMAFWPDVAVHLTYIDIAKSDFVAHGDGRNSLMIGGSLRIPLDVGRVRAGIEENRIRRQQIRFQTEDLTSRIRTELLSVYGQLRQQEAQSVRLETGLIPLAKSTLEATLNAYSTDRASFLDLLEAERTLFSLKWERIDLQVRYFQTIARLQRELGAGAPEMQHERGN